VRASLFRHPQVYPTPPGDKLSAPVGETDHVARTFGVEEELMLVDPVSGTPASAGDTVHDAAVQRLGANADRLVEREFKMEQTEIGSTPTDDVVALRDELLAVRRTVAAAAGSTGVHVVAIATNPFVVNPTLTENERYARMAEMYGIIAAQQLTCGQHIHVAIDSAEEGVAALDRIRGWLPLLVALSANSPYWQGRDTGYASYRSIAWGQWPTAGPTETFGTVEGYHRAISDLQTTGAAMDDGMIYFDARLSASYPTLEIRVPDVSMDVGDSALIAALARALVDTASAEWRHGHPAEPIRIEVLRGAAWRAARFGLTGELHDHRSRTLVPAWAMIDALVQHVLRALRANGDLDFVLAGIDRLRGRGTGADVQRAEFARRGLLMDVVQLAAQRTLE
jgi:glutamate---cysteine ligase / carboxylate-amine ligase